MAASGMVTQDLAALEQARERLEAALAGDESWRALRTSEGQDGAPESAARRARNTRLKMALAENPLYQAWKHLGEAIAALHADPRTQRGRSGGTGGRRRRADSGRRHRQHIAGQIRLSREKAGGEPYRHSRSPAKASGRVRSAAGGRQREPCPAARPHQEPA